MRIIANRQLSGVYGTVVDGQEFEVADDIALQLLAANLVRKPGPPRVLYDSKVSYQTKVVIPEASEVGPRQPFRDVPLSHQEPPIVVTESDPVLPAADVSEQGTADTSRRGKRSGSASGR